MKVYYLSFFLLVKFYQLIDKRDNEPGATAFNLLNIIMGSNIFTIAIILFKYSILNVEPIWLSVFLLVPIIVLNYIYLLRNDRDVELIKYYSAYWEGLKRNKLAIVLLFIGYIILSFVICGYLAFAIKNKVL